MPEGKEIGKAYVTVNLDDQTDEDYARIRSKYSDKAPLDLKTRLNDPDDLGAVKARIESRLSPVKAKVDVDQSSLDDTGRKLDSETEKWAKRESSQFSALGVGAAMAGLPAVAAAAGVGVAAGLAGIPAVFGLIGARALASNAQVADSYGALKVTVADDIQQMVAPMRSQVVSAIHQMGDAANVAKPQLSALFQAGGQDLPLLVDGVTSLGLNALPGMVTAAQSARPALQGLDSMFAQTGAGVSDFFANLSTGAQGSQAVLTSTGGILRDFSGFAGSLFANIANQGNPSLQAFRGSLSAVESTLLSVSTNGMPALNGAATGLLGTFSGLATVANGAMQALGSWAAPLGSLGGNLYATNSVAKLFGTSIGQTGFGVSAFAKSVQDGSAMISPFGAALRDAEGFSGKFKSGLSSILENGLNPLGVGMIATGFILDAIGQKQQEAAQKTAAHQEAVRQLTQAYQEDNGVLGENVKQAQAQAFTAKSVAVNAEAAGLGLGLYTSAADGNSGALGTITARTNDVLAATLRAAGGTSQQVSVLQRYNSQLLESGGTAADYKDQLDQIGQVYNDQAGDVTHLSQAQRNQIDAILNASGALGDQVRAQKAAHDQYLLSESTLSGLTSAQVQNRDATEAATKAIYDQQNAHLGLRGAQLSTRDALNSYDQTLANSKATDFDKQKALLGVEQAFAAEEQAAYNAAYADSKATTESGKVADAQAAANREAVNLADTFRGPLPESLQATISKMDVTSGRAAGLTVEIDNTGAAVYRLPDGKTIKIDADTASVLRALTSATGYLDAFVGQKRTVVIDTVVHGPNAASLTGPRAAFAEGGIVSAASAMSVGGPSSSAVSRALGVPTQYFADGGLTPMSSVAQVVAPRTMRVVGDNLTTPEAYIPLDPRSFRSQEILTQANAAMGRSEPTQNVDNSRHMSVVVQAPSANANDIAQAVARELAWGLRF